MLSGGTSSQPQRRDTTRKGMPACTSIPYWVSNVGSTSLLNRRGSRGGARLCDGDGGRRLEDRPTLVRPEKPGTAAGGRTGPDEVGCSHRTSWRSVARDRGTCRCGAGCHRNRIAALERRISAEIRPDKSITTRDDGRSRQVGQRGGVEGRSHNSPRTSPGHC